MIIYSHGREGSKRPQMPRYYGSHGEWEPKKMLLEGSGKTALFFYTFSGRHNSQRRSNEICHSKRLKYNPSSGRTIMIFSAP